MLRNFSLLLVNAARVVMQTVVTTLTRLLYVSQCPASTPFPITSPYKCPTSPLCPRLLLPARPDRPRTHVELATTIHSRLFRRQRNA